MSHAKPAPFLAVALITTAGLVTMAILGNMPTYHAAPFFLVPVTWAIFALRRLLNIQPWHYALICSALLLHMSGAFGFYQHSPLPFSFDILVHYWFAVVLTLGVNRLLEGNFPLRGWHLAVLTFFIMMGLAAMHEIMEYMSYLVLGEKNGMLKPAIMYFFDTQRDLTNNLLGTLTSLSLLFIVRRLTHRRPDAESVSAAVPQAHTTSLTT
jgi:uncharacterized membrane protein YjdF